MGSPRGTQRAEQIVAGKPLGLVDGRKHPGAAVQNAVYKPHCLRAADEAGQLCAQRSVVHGWEELMHVTLEKIPMPARKVLGAVQGGVGALAGAAGVGVVNETRLPEGHDDPAEGVVHHPVPEGRRADETQLAFLNVEVAVRSRLVGLSRELVLQLEEIRLQVVLEGGHFPPVALPFPSQSESSVEVGKSDDISVEMAEGAHGRSQSASNAQFVLGYDNNAAS